MLLLGAVLLMLLVGCSEPDAPPASAPIHSADTPVVATPSVAPAPSPERKKTAPPDPRWRFFTSDRRRYASTWFAGRHRIMIGFGCTPAPYYSPDPSCSGGDGFHHGIDVALPCGTPLSAGRPATVLPNDALGSAYGDNPVLLRVGGFDVVIGHTRQVLVSPGDTVKHGQRFALASDSGAPDGCHLHFEVRRAGTGLSGAVAPGRLLGLH